MKKNIIGVVVFRDEGNGCLTAKWMNDSSESPFVEACKFREAVKVKDKFCGVYDTVWIEDGRRHVKGELKIEKNPRNSDIYKLYWYKPNDPNTMYFEGSGMLFSDLLTCAFWD